MKVKGRGYYGPPVELAFMLLRKGASRLVLVGQELRAAIGPTRKDLMRKSNPEKETLPRQPVLITHKSRRRVPRTLDIQGEGAALLVLETPRGAMRLFLENKNEASDEDRLLLLEWRMAGIECQWHSHQAGRIGFLPLLSPIPLRSSSGRIRTASKQRNMVSGSEPSPSTREKRKEK